LNYFLLLQSLVQSTIKNGSFQKNKLHLLMNQFLNRCLIAALGIIKSKVLNPY